MHTYLITPNNLLTNDKLSDVIVYFLFYKQNLNYSIMKTFYTLLILLFPYILIGQDC